METSTFGRWLKRLRAEQDLTQEMLAERIGCATPTLRAFETGKRRPSREMAERLAECLHVPREQHAEFLRMARLPVGVGGELLAPGEPGKSSGASLRPSLPAFDNALIGREAERNVLIELLRDQGRRLVTVVGIGGVGKTRLALEVAATLTPYFPDGAAFVSLAPIESARSVPAAVLGALGVPAQGAFDPWPQLLAALASRRLLLILDNFEHLLAGAADATLLVKAILQCAPGVQVLVTSRERLRVGGEHVFELSGLSVPVGASRPEQAGAVLLYLERAQQVDHEFVLTAQNTPAIARICSLVEGMPLAIELAAAWVSTLTPAEIVDEIARNVDFLTLAQRDAPARHRNLRAVFDHSWDLLSQAERAALAKLSVFHGGCGREAAEAVAGAGLPVVASLIDKSLVRRTQTDSRARYELHELVQQYAAARLAEAGEVERTRDRHLAYYLQFVETAAPELYGPHQGEWMARVAQEHENLRKALEWAFETGSDQRPERPEQGLRLVGKLDRYWQGGGKLKEGCRWLERGLVHRVVLPSAVQATALNLWGWLVNQQGGRARATSLQQESLMLFRQVGDEAGEAQALDGLGDIAWIENDFARAQACYEEALAIRRRLDDQPGTGLSLYSLGRLHVDHGQAGPALELLHEGLEVLRACQDRRGIALALNGLGRLDLRQGRHAAAAARIREALEIFDALGNQVDVAECLEELAAAADGQGDPILAMRLGGAAEALREAIGLDAPTGHLDWVGGAMRGKLSQPDLAAAWAAGRTLSIQEAVGLALGSVTGEARRESPGYR